MPMAPRRVCAQPGCHALVTAGRCLAHIRQQRHVAETQRGTAQQRGYTAAWARYSKQWRATHPLCGQRQDGRLYAQHSRCVQQGRLTATDLVVDHIVPMSQGGAQWDAANHQTLCRACNSAKDGYGHGDRASHDLRIADVKPFGKTSARMVEMKGL